MTIQFVSVSQENYLECIDLSVDDTQNRYIAPNVFSLVQAAYDPEMYPLAISNNETRVGFILFHLDEELSG
ncbi:hypothetical protein NRIC_04740 [Enterococcus florum]|uniref:Uncharacterized protein n=1 Tax=Enterococcus florum TaxID=2480627 RepID=A0A4P5PGG9_9ENTE|nr:hypothetical protein [Enterococcus florum]GCF92583.1 hypothetical protein NRIC_04740 [Enterococcus florum]